MAGELTAGLDGDRSLLSIHARILPGIDVDLQPTVDPAAAIESPSVPWPGAMGSPWISLNLRTRRSWIYNPVLMGFREDLTRLVWRLEVVSLAGRPVRDLVLVDAHTGKVALQFSRIHYALNRSVADCDNEQGAASCPYVRLEGSSESGIDQAY